MFEDTSHILSLYIRAYGFVYFVKFNRTIQSRGNWIFVWRRNVCIKVKERQTDLRSSLNFFFLFFSYDYWLNWFNANHSGLHTNSISYVPILKWTLRDTDSIQIYVAHLLQIIRIMIYIFRRISSLALTASYVPLPVIRTINRNNLNVSTVVCTQWQAAPCIVSLCFSHFTRIFIFWLYLDTSSVLIHIRLNGIYTIEYQIIVISCKIEHLSHTHTHSLSSLACLCHHIM